MAETAVVTGDIRAVSPEQPARVQDTLRALARENLPHTRASISFGDGYPPLASTEGNRELLAISSRASQDLGYGAVTAVNPLLAGAADVSFTAAHVEMAIDGLGMSGTAGHTVEETGILSALPQQAKRAAVVVTDEETQKLVAIYKAMGTERGHKIKLSESIDQAEQWIMPAGQP